MLPATDSARLNPSRWPLVGLALLSILLDAGCSRLRAFRQDDRQAFGTNTSWSDRGPDGKSSNGDLYAELAVKSGPAARPRPIANLAIGEIPKLDLKPVIDESPPRAGDSSPLVTLQPPLVLPPFQDNATLVAHRAPARPLVASIEIRAPRIGPIGLAAVLEESRKAIDALKTYQVKMTHQERVNDRLNPIEDVILSIRRAPKAVRLEWLDGPNKGREVLYAADANGGLMHVRMAPTLVPLPRLSMAPDSPLATRNSRHPITEAGLEPIVANMEDAYAKSLKNDQSRGRLSYEGLVVADGSTTPCHKIVRVTPERETWTVLIDPETHLPVSVQAIAGNGDLLEQYTFREPILDLPELANADAFDPDHRWGPSKGLFQRLARTTPEPDKPTATR